MQKQLNQFDEKQSVDEYSSLLHKAKKMLPILAQDPRVIEVADSVLWHHDMHLGRFSSLQTTKQPFKEQLTGSQLELLLYSYKFNSQSY